MQSTVVRASARRTSWLLRAVSTRKFSASRKSRIKSRIVSSSSATRTVVFFSTNPVIPCGYSGICQLQAPVYIPFTVFGALGAVLVFALIGRLSRRPVRLYRIIASVVLVVSFVPDFLLLSAPHASGIAVGALIVMHIATYLITVGMLTTMSRAK
jgi:hypothetical protein